MSKCGTSEVHCCWFAGVECVFVEPVTVGDFKWRCTLRAKYGSWELVHSSPEYVSDIKEKMNAVGGLGLDCGDYPCTGNQCNTCGEAG